MREDQLDGKKQKNLYVNIDQKSKKKLPFIQKNSVTNINEKSESGHLGFSEGFNRHKKNNSLQNNRNLIPSSRLTPKNDSGRRRREFDKTSSQSYDLAKRSQEQLASDTFDKLSRKKASPKAQTGKKTPSGIKQKQKYVTVRSTQHDQSTKPKISFLDDVFSRDSLYNKIHSSFGVSHNQIGHQVTGNNANSHNLNNAQSTKTTILNSKFRNSMTQSVRKATITGPNANSQTNMNFPSNNNPSLLSQASAHHQVLNKDSNQNIISGALNRATNDRESYDNIGQRGHYHDGEVRKGGKMSANAIDGSKKKRVLRGIPQNKAKSNFFGCKS